MPQARLVDDGTLDTVISVDGCEHRFSQDWRAIFTREDGSLRPDALMEAIEDHEDNCLEAT